MPIMRKNNPDPEHVEIGEIKVRRGSGWARHGGAGEAGRGAAR